MSYFKDSADFLGEGFTKMAEKNNRLPYLMQHGIGLSRIGAREGRRKFDFVGDFCLDIIMAYMPYGPGKLNQLNKSEKKNELID